MKYTMTINYYDLRPVRQTGVPRIGVSSAGGAATRASDFVRHVRKQGGGRGGYDRVSVKLSSAMERQL